jgi:hypothetical protein
MMNIVRVIRNIIVNSVALYKAMKLDPRKEIDIISVPELEMTDDVLAQCDGDKETAQNVIDIINSRRVRHEDMIRNTIDVLENEGLIKNHITVELNDKDVNCHRAYPWLTEDKNKHTIVKYYGHEIHVSYINDSDFNDFMARYIAKTFNVVVYPMSSTFALFTFLHEFGHYVDSILGHEEEYVETNKELKKTLDTIEDKEERRLAYRQIPDEAFADKWAIDFMIKHFPEYLYSVNGLVLEEQYC